MAKKAVTYNQLWLVQANIEDINNTMPALALFQGNRFDKFLKDNRQELVVLNKRMQQVQLRYIDHNSDVQPLKNEETGDWKYLESVVADNGQLLTGEAVREAYLKEAREFLRKSVTIEI